MIAYHGDGTDVHWWMRWALIGAILLAMPPWRAGTAQAQRIFYYTRGWLATSPETQMRLVAGTLRAWEELAEAAEARGPAAEALPAREREALRLMECIRVFPGLTVEEVRQAIQAYASRHPEEVFSSFGDLAGRALARPCRTPHGN